MSGIRGVDSEGQRSRLQVVSLAQKMTGPSGCELSGCSEALQFQRPPRPLSVELAAPRAQLKLSIIPSISCNLPCILLVSSGIFSALSMRVPHCFKLLRVPPRSSRPIRDQTWLALYFRNSSISLEHRAPQMTSPGTVLGLAPSV